MVTHERRQGEELAARQEKRFGKRPATVKRDDLNDVEAEHVRPLQAASKALPPSATAGVVSADEG